MRPTLTGLASFVILFIACNSNPSGKPGSQDGDSLFRSHVSTDAVARFREKIQNRLNDWYFGVTLYETARPRDYVVHLEYEEMYETDTVSFPKMPYPIKPAVLKGKDSLTCYIGFLSPQGEFEYFKGVSVDSAGLHLETVRTYDTQ